VDIITHFVIFFKGTALGNFGSKTDPGLSLEKENLGKDFTQTALKLATTTFWSGYGYFPEYWSYGVPQ
jgi:hypothetical protein